MDLAGITYVDEGGARIALCSEHRQELCHHCCLDYTDSNGFERERAKADEARKCWAPDCSSEATKTCQGCGRARYCGRECQKASWRGHKAECRAAAAPGGGFRPRTLWTFQFQEGPNARPSTAFQELAPGTKVRLEDRSGRDPPVPLLGTIVSTNMDAVDEWTGKPLPTYHIKFKNGESEEIACEDVAMDDEWSVGWREPKPKNEMK